MMIFEYIQYWSLWHYEFLNMQSEKVNLVGHQVQFRNPFIQKKTGQDSGSNMKIMKFDEVKVLGLAVGQDGHPFIAQQTAVPNLGAKLGTGTQHPKNPWHMHHQRICYGYFLMRIFLVMSWLQEFSMILQWHPTSIFISAHKNQDVLGGHTSSNPRIKGRLSLAAACQEIVARW